MPPLDHNGPWNISFSPFDGELVWRGVETCFHRVLEKCPDHLALDDGKLALSYAELDRASRALAGRLIAAAPEDGPIGLLLPGNASFWVAIIACLRAGRAYVPLDLHHPAARNRDIIADAALAAILTPDQGETVAGLLTPQLTRIVLDDAQLRRDAVLTPPGAALPDQPPAPTAPAAILYTSGSTGRPKGIVNGQPALLQRVAQHVAASHLHPGDRCLTLSSPCSIAGTREGLAALLTGATLYLLDTPRSSLGDVRRLIAGARITVLNAVPSLFRSLFVGGISPDSLASLRLVRLGGEPVFRTDIALFHRLLPEDCHIQIGYSSTETTGTQWFVPRNCATLPPIVPVGYVLPGNDITVRDPDGVALPADAVGELVVRSPFVALGLWRQGRLVPGGIRTDPAAPDCRILATGDLGSIAPDGLCSLVGRRDRQVKIHGTRVEPAEVEAVLRAVPELDDVAVIASQIGEAGRLVAFIVPHGGDARDALRQARTILRSQLPSHMRPARIWPLAAIPRLPGAKLDVVALRQIDAAEAPTSLPHLASGDEAGPPAAARDTEEAVRRAWRALLGRRAYAAGTSFEECGGDSLRLLQMVQWLETLLHRPLRLDLFQTRMRPRDFVAAIEQAEPGEPAPDRRPTLFLLPGLPGDEPRLAQLRQELRPRLAVRLVDYPDWPEMARDGGDFDRLVAHVAKRIEAGADHTPLMLAGYSFGGEVAYAAALQLIAAGRAVGFLGILDTDLTRTTPPVRTLRHWLAHVRTLHAEMGTGMAVTIAGLLLAKLAREAIGLRRVAGAHELCHRLLPPRIAYVFDRRLRTSLRLEARMAWRLRQTDTVLTVPTLLCRSHQHPPEAPLDLGWRPRCARLTVVPVSGDHHSMLEPPHRAVLADCLAQAVADAVAPRQESAA